MSRIIKRYENRKLYDTEKRTYVSLEEIAALVRKGVDVRVIDQKTEADITAQTLTQVLFEEGKKGRNPFSTEMLHDIIRWGHTMVDGSLQQVRQRLDHVLPKPLNKMLGLKSNDDLDKLIKKVDALEDAVSKLVQQKSSEVPERSHAKRSKSQNKLKGDSHEEQ